MNRRTHARTEVWIGIVILFILLSLAVVVVQTGPSDKRMEKPAAAEVWKP
jgi:hypothetical protein